jgi:hypothetical protein
MNLDCGQRQILIQWILECYLDYGSYKDLFHRVKRSIMYQCMELIFQMGKIQKISIGCLRKYLLDVANLPAEVITQGVSMIHGEFSKFFRAEYFNGESNKQGGSLALLRGIQQCFIDIQNHCVRATDELSRLVIETASQRPATLKDFRTRELALEMQSQLWELSKFEPLGTYQEEIAKKFCRFQIREEGTRLNTAMQNAIGFALSRLLDPSPEDALTN